MKLYGRALLAACATLCAAAPAALADGTDPDYPGSSLHVAVTGPTVAGSPVNIQATGSNGATDPPINYGLYIFLVNPDKLPGPCATSEETEEDNTANNPQAARQLNFLTYNEGTGGPFTINVPFTPGGAGDLLICAYSVYVTDDAAYASTTTTITGGTSTSPTPTTTTPTTTTPTTTTVTVTAPAKTTPAARPHDTVRPKVTRHGKVLSCTRGTWSGKPSSYSYRWKVGGKAASGRRSSLKLAARVHGSAVCTVTARNAAGSASAASRSLKLG